MSEHMPTVAEAEERLAIEESYMDHAIMSGKPSIIALAQDNINRWTRLLREARLRESGGWTT